VVAAVRVPVVAQARALALALVAAQAMQEGAEELFETGYLVANSLLSSALA